MFKNSLGVITCNGEDCAHINDCSFYKEGAEKSAMGSAICPHYITRYDHVTTMSLDELAEWLKELFDGQAETPWDNWINEKFCSDCPAVTKTEWNELFQTEMTQTYAPCEFGDDQCPHNVAGMSEPTIIKLWLMKYMEV